MADTEMKWYVMRAVSGKESKVKEYIDAEIKKGDFGKFVSQASAMITGPANPPYRSVAVF